MKKWRIPARFILGGSAYVGLEVLFRGRSHGSMFLAGGTCFLILGQLHRFSLPLRAVIGSAVVTAVELGTGFLFNRDYRVWDYRDLPLNYRGQICLPFSVLWMPVSLAAVTVYDALDS